MAVAHLGIAVDSKQAVSAAGDLNVMTKASMNAEKAAASLQRGSKAADTAIAALGSHANVAAAGVTTMARASDVAAAAQARLATQSGLARMQAQNLGFQIQDIGTMLAMGQSPFMLLAQQLPQVTQNGGKLTGVMDALRGSIANIFSPLGLLTTGFVLAGSAAVSYFTSASDDADAAAEALDEQARLIDRVADRWGDAIPALRQYANELERVREESELAAGVQELSNRAWEEARSILPDLRQEIGSVVQELMRANQTDATINSLRDAFNEADRAAQDLRKAIDEGTQETADFQRVVDALSRLMANEGVQGADDLQKMIGELRDRYGEAADEAIRLAEAEAAVLAGGPIGGERIAAGKGNRAGGPVTLSDEQFAGRFGWEDYFSFPKDPKERRPRRSEAERDAERARENYSRMIRDSEQFIAAQELERQALNMTEQAANRLRYEQDMLNQAASDSITLTPAQTDEIRNLAAGMAAAEAETARLTRTHEAWNQAGERGVDLLTNLIDGTMTWQDALRGAIPIIQDLIGELTRAGGVGGSHGGGGLFRSLLGGLGSLMGGVSPTSALWAPNTTFGSFIGANASGTDNWRGGLTWVGERGPEIAKLPRGTEVIPNHRIRPFMNDNRPTGAGGGGGLGTLSINVNVSGARGSAEIEDAVQRGVSRGIGQFAQSREFGTLVQASNKRARQGKVA